MLLRDEGRLTRQNHVSDEDILRFADGELPVRRAAEMRAHFETCWECRTRLMDVQRTIADFVHLNEELLACKIPPIDGPLAQLKAALGAQPVKQKQVFLSRVLPLSAAAAALVMFSLFVFTKLGSHKDSSTLQYPAEPLAALTPGQTVPVSREQVCSSDLIAPPVLAPGLKQRVFAAYGLAHPQEEDFEIDYLITPELGGAETMKNLWPEPYRNTVWNAHVKDRLEVRLRDLVCSGRIDLATAQRDLAMGWVAAYQRYFESKNPAPPTMPAILLLAGLER